MKNYKMIESMLKQDFEMAKDRRDFRGMGDDYELLRELWATGELDSEEYHNTEFAPVAHQFTEVNGNKIHLPSEYKSCVQKYGKRVLYSLEDDSIKIILNNVDDERIIAYFEEDGIETKHITFYGFIEINQLAKRTLQLHNADIVEISVNDEMIVIFKA